MAGKCRRRAYARVAALYRHQSQGQQLSNKEEYGDTVFMQVEEENQDDGRDATGRVFSRPIPAPV